MAIFALLDESPSPPAAPGPEQVGRADHRAPLRDGTAAATFQAIALSCLDRFASSRDALARTGDPETLHQARVALRQLRTALAVFRRIALDDRFEHLRGELRWLAATTNEARDLDALIARMSAPPPSMLAARRRAWARTAKILASARANRLVHDLADWLTAGAWLEVRNQADWPAVAFAADSLDRLRDRLAVNGRHLRSLDDAALHEVRISAKKLRYAASFFADLFPGEKAARRAKRFIDAMRTLQDRLGEVQDIAVAPAALERLAVPRDFWPDLAKRKRLVRSAADDFERALDCKPFWR